MPAAGEQGVARAHTLAEALPYIHRFYGQTLVIKYGGAAMEEATLQEKVLQDIALLRLVGMKPVVVHGGGPELTRVAEQMGLESVFREGLRVTTSEMRDAALMVLAGLLNKRIVALLNRAGVPSVGLSGVDGSLFQVEPLRRHRGKEVDLGYVGEIQQVNTHLLRHLLEGGYIPVLSTLGVNAEGEIFNINADHAAGAVAGALKAEKVIFLTDVRGLLRHPPDETTLIPRLTLAEAKRLLESGSIEGGMIPKLHGCILALEQGVRRAHIIDGRLEHSLLIELFTDEGIGTMIE